MEYKRRIQAMTRDKQQQNVNTKTSRRSRWSTSTDAPSSCGRGDTQHCSVPTQLADHTLLLQGRRYPEARDLRWTKYGGCCSNIITCYGRRFSSVQQHSIRSGTAPWATFLAAAVEAVLTGVSDMLSLNFLLSVVWLSCLPGVRSCGGHRGLGCRFWACFQAVRFCFFFVVRIKPHFDCRTRSYPLSVPG